MGQFDTQFKRLCTEIMENGTDTRGEECRPHWDDGTSAYTMKVFGAVNRYDLHPVFDPEKGAYVVHDFPVSTQRRTPIKLASQEMLWIWQKQSNNIADLDSHVWDSWADGDGSIGKAYGYQAGRLICHKEKEISREGIKKAFPDSQGTEGEDGSIGFRKGNGHLIATWAPSKGWMMSQVDRMLYDLVNTPFSRRIIVTFWEPEDLCGMNLAPCAYSMTFNVTEKQGRRYLNAVLNQRSNDLLAAGAWNVAQYSILLMMVARSVGLFPGELLHVIADAHIYDRHLPLIKELIQRDTAKGPDVYLTPGIQDFYSFTASDIHVDGYKVMGEQIRDIPVAV